MEKTEIKKQGNAIIVDGVILTEDALRFLASLQNGDNGYLKEAREEITNVISHLIDYSDEFEGEELKEYQSLIRYINTFNKNLKQLMKP